MRRLALAATLPLLLAACSSNDGGVVASSKTADRTVEIDVLDSLRFDPTTLPARAGETVKFVITNNGRVDHEFAIGGAAFQVKLDETPGGEHGGGHGGGDLPDGGEVVAVAAGKTATLTYTMPDVAPSYVCYVDDHNTSGMKGTVTYS